MLKGAIEVNKLLNYYYNYLQSFEKVDTFSPHKEKDSL